MKPVSSSPEEICSDRWRRPRDCRSSAIQWPTQNRLSSRTPLCVHAGSRCSTSRSTLAWRNWLRRLKALPAAGFIGANFTIPHKAAALAIVDEADDYARKAGAVNTIVVEGEKLIGFNTDGPGLLRALREEFYVDLRDLRVMLLGAGGGAGRAIAVQCAFESCERLVLVNRTFEKAEALAQELSSYFRSDRLVGPAERLEAFPLKSVPSANNSPRPTSSSTRLRSA